MHITVIGETNIDIQVKPENAVSTNGCIPSSLSFHFGGVARNIATELIQMGHNVRLMTLFGDDNYALQLKNDCKQRNIDLSLSETKSGFHSPFFLCHTDDVGNIQSAFSDMKINTMMDMYWIEHHIDEIKKSEIVVADTLLNSEALAFLIHHCEVPIFIDTVSPNKAHRLVEALKDSQNQLFALKCNRQEAFAMTNTSDTISSALALTRMGIRHVYVTMGADGVVYCDGAKVVQVPALSAQVVNVIGSGDAFLAGIVDALSKGANGEAALPYGLTASRAVIESRNK